MKRIFFYLSIFFVAGSLSLSACTNNNDDDDDDNTGGTVTYNDDIKPIITSNCLGCHSGAGANAGLDLSTYANVKASAEGGKFTARINDAASPMPPAGLMAQSTRDLVQSWIDGGYIE